MQEWIEGALRGIVEQTTVELIQQGVDTPQKLFQEVGNRLSTLGMGDLEYWYRLRSMSERPNAILEIGSTSPFEQAKVSLTELGVAVASGVKDWLTLKGRDERYGGLLLNGALAWRWDDKNKRLVYVK